MPTFDSSGNLVLSPEEAAQAAIYGTKFLYAGLPPSTPYPPVAASRSVPSDTNAAANSVAEGAAANTPVGLTVSATNTAGTTVTYALTADSSGGGFKIDAATGVVSVANGTKIDFETAPGHVYTVTVQANSGGLTSSQSFTIGVTDVAPSTPVDSNAVCNSVAEGAAAGTLVGVPASSSDVNGPAVTYSLIGDTSGGGFKIDPLTGVVSVADPTKINFESSGAGHSYDVTVQASDGGVLTSSKVFTIAVTDAPPSAPVDVNGAANSVAEGAAANTPVGITAASTTSVNDPAATYALISDTSGGGFKIDSVTGVVSVADPTKLDYETAGHAYTVIVQASDGVLTSSQVFTIGVTDVAPSVPVDSNASANSVAEGAAANTLVGITASSSTSTTDPAATYSLTADSSLGGFKIDPVTGVVSVNDPIKIDYENSGAGHSYTITVQASDGTLTSSQTFSIGVTDPPLSAPVDSNAAANSVAEGAAANTLVGLTAFAATPPNDPAATYSLIADSSLGGFKIDSVTGVVSVNDPTKLDYETAVGHAYSITVQANDGVSTATSTFTIGITDPPPSAPVDTDATANSVAEGAAVNTLVGITASATTATNDPAATYSIIVDHSGGGFKINSTTGVVSVNDPTKIDFDTAPGHSC